MITRLMHGGEVYNLRLVWIKPMKFSIILWNYFSNVPDNKDGHRPFVWKKKNKQTMQISRALP